MRIADSGLTGTLRNPLFPEEVGYQKPQKEFFDRCFEAMPGAERNGPLIVGDSLNSDIKVEIQRELTPAGLIRRGCSYRRCQG